MIVVTLPLHVPEEHTLLHAFFQEGLCCLHVRKPGIDQLSMRQWLEAIPVAFRKRLVLHQHHELAEAYGIQRLHIPEYTRLTSDKDCRLPGYTYTTSVHDIHTFNELNERYEYALLSPVLESISKPGYKSKQFLLEQMEQRNRNDISLIALGGLHAGNLSVIDHKGFDDFAVSGGLWYADDPLDAFRQMQLYPLNK